MTERSIFLAALEKVEPVERAAYLDQACAEQPELRRRVEVLLEAVAQAGSFLGVPADHKSTGVYLPESEERNLAILPLTEGPGTVIGPYKLLQQIGEGGFGSVFMAEQERPIRRMVALKIIKAGMDTREVIARFESERQALALMDHPNIAKVLDAGTTEAGDRRPEAGGKTPDLQSATSRLQPVGRPYFVMELVKGVPITEFCDKNHLPPQQRLKLFLDVCHAIQHAHHKGVIHRDIKPSNVMVTLHDGEPVVKVIDFGVAKAIVQKLTEKTLFTVYGQMVGTPAYMSPEQAEMSGLDIDTRSDVYSLGVLLYELLTGTTPLENKRLREAGYAEMQRLIREVEAPRPSNRLSSLGDSATMMAGNRGLDVKRLVQLLTGDLDWVVMKALDKDRNRRYATPGSFAEDIERYLRHDAILARPPSTAYKLKKFVHRHRAAVVTGVSVAVALLLGTAVATWQAIVATQAKQEALAAAAAEKEAKQEAEAREAETKAVLDFVEKQVFAAARPEGQEGGLGREVTLLKAVEASLPYVGKNFANQPLIAARLRMTLGASYYFLGEAQKAAEQYETARALFGQHRGPDHLDTLRSMNNLGLCYDALGRLTEALKLREETLAVLKTKHGTDHPDTLRSMNNLANSYDALGRHADALKLREETLALMKTKFGSDQPDTLRSMNNLALSYVNLGRHLDGLKLREETLALMKAKLGPDHPDTLRSMDNLALSYVTLGRPADGLKLREETLALMKTRLGPDHADTLRCMMGVANSYFNFRRHADALKLREETLTLMKLKLGPDHPDTLRSMYNLANSLKAVGRPEDALHLQKEAVALSKAKLGRNHPETLQHMWGLAASLAQLDRGAEAVTIVDECMQQLTGKGILAPALPEWMVYRSRHFAKIKDAAGCRHTAQMWEKLQRTDAAGCYTAARLRAVTAAVCKATPGTDADRLANEEADQAMFWLKKAIAAGFKDAARMKQDKELTVLRDREDFKKLLAEMSAAK